MLIGLTGYAQSGKDTLAQELVENYGFTRVAFADKIRELLYELNPETMSECGSLRLRTAVDDLGWEQAKKIPEVRRLLQDIGLGARKIFGEYFWIEQALKNIPSKYPHGARIVVTDVRFINEADWIKKYENSHIWRVKRPNVGAVNSHVSESEMDGYKADQIFNNTGTVEDLKRLVKIRMGLVNDL